MKLFKKLKIKNSAVIIFPIFVVIIVLGLFRLNVGESKNKVVLKPGIYSVAVDNKTLDLPKNSFAANEPVKFVILLKNGENKLHSRRQGFVKSVWAEEKATSSVTISSGGNSVSVKLYYAKENLDLEGREVYSRPSSTTAIQMEPQNDGQYGLSVLRKKDQEFQPGEYILVTDLEQNGQKQHFEQKFSWGVLAVNTNKSIYTLGEKVYLQMAALNKYGHTRCDEDLKLEITDPANHKTSLIPQKSKTCGADNVTDNPDYFAYYDTKSTGTYNIKLINNTNKYSIEDKFEVIRSVILNANEGSNIDSSPSAQNDKFVVERVGATRINPFKSEYKMSIKVTANEDFEGKVEESVPSSFVILNANEGSNIDSSPSAQNDNIKISWNVNLIEGEEITLQYTYQAPKISPELFLLGPLRLADARSGSSTIIFQEARQWQIASDAACNGTTTGNWSTGSNWTGCSGAGGVPASADDITINSGITITADTTATVNSIIIADQTVSNGINISSGVTLTVTTSVTIYGSSTTASKIGKLDVGSGTLTAASVTLNGGIASGRLARLDIGTGTANISGNISCGTANQARALVIFNGAGNIYLGGNLYADGSCVGGTNNLNLTAGTLTLNGSSAQTIFNNSTYGNIVSSNTFGGVSFVTTTSSTIGGSLTVTTGNFNTVAGAMTVSGTTTINSGGTITQVTGTGTRTFTGLFTVNSGGTYDNSASTSVTYSNGITNNGTFNNGATGAAVIFGTNNQTLSGSGNTLIFSTLTVNAGLIVTSNINVTSTVSLIGSGTFTQGQNVTLDLQGGTISVGTLDASAAGNTVKYSRPATQTIKSATYHHLIISNTNAKTAGGALTVNGNFTLSDTATFTTGAYTHNFLGNWTIDTSAATPITATGSTINFNTPGTPAATSIIDGATTATLALVTVNINNTSGFSINENVSFSSTLTVASSVTVTPGAGNIISGAGTLTGNGTVQVTRTAATADFSSQYTITTKTLTNLTVDYVGAGAQTVNALTYFNLKVRPGANATTHTLAAGTTIVNGDFTAGDGTHTSAVVDATTAGTILDVNGNFSISPNTEFKANAASSFTIAGNFTNNGTLSGNSGTVTFDDATKTSTINGTTTFYSFTVSTANKRLMFVPGITYTFAGTLTLNGQATGTRVNVLSNNIPSQWTIVVSGTAAVTNTFIQGATCSSGTITLDNTDRVSGISGSCWSYGSTGVPMTNTRIGSQGAAGKGIRINGTVRIGQ